MLTEIPIPTIMSEGTQITGAVVFQSSGEIHGLIEGDILQNSLERIKVGRGGWIHGTITSQGPIIVEGRVEGSITSSTLIHLLPSAHVIGTITSPTIRVDNGAVVEAELRMKAAISKVSMKSAA